MPKNGPKVISHPGTIALINEAMKMPQYLTADDGRIFEILNWSPNSVLDEMLTVTTKLTVEMPASNTTSVETSNLTSNLPPQK